MSSDHEPTATEPTDTEPTDTEPTRASSRSQRTPAETYADWKMGKPCTEHHTTPAEQDACPLCPPVRFPEPSFAKPASARSASAGPATVDDTDWAVALDRPDPTFHGSQQEHNALTPGTPSSATPPATASLLEPYPRHTYASIKHRFLAWLLDLGVWIVLALTLGTTLEKISGSVGVGTVAFWLSAFGYYTLPTAFAGQTVAKLVCGLSVVRADDHTRPPGLKQSVLRSLTFLAVSFVPLVQLIDAFNAVSDAQHKMLHDRAARTRVVATR